MSNNDLYLVAVGGAVAALLLAASEHLLWEVEGDDPSHLEGTAVDQAGQEANLGAVQGPHVVERYLVQTKTLSSRRR